MKPLVFHTGKGSYEIDPASVLEIIPREKTHRVHGQPAHVSGYFSYSGAVWSLLDPTAVPELAEGKHNEEQSEISELPRFFILLRSERHRVALAASRVLENNIDSNSNEPSTRGGLTPARFDADMLLRFLDNLDS